MSASRLSLKSPPVIAGVAIALVAVVVFNLRTFGISLPGYDGGVTRYRQHPPAPVNLQLASESNVSLDQVLNRPAAVPPGLVRDPFDCRKPRSTPTVTSRTVTTSETDTKAAVPDKSPRKAKPGELICSAVLLGGEQPLALIGGKAYVVGDRVGGFEVKDISATGVLLAKAGGKTRRLPVGPDNSGTTSFKVVTSLRSPADHGRTSLAEHE